MKERAEKNPTLPLDPVSSPRGFNLMAYYVLLVFLRKERLKQQQENLTGGLEFNFFLFSSGMREPSESPNGEPVQVNAICFHTCFGFGL